MKQASLDFPLTPFEKVTCQQLVSYKITKGENETDASVNKRIKAMIKSDKLKAEASAMVNRWNNKRIKLNLKPWS